MPDLTSSNVTVLRSWSTTLSNGLILQEKAVKMTLTAHGTLSTNEKIPATALSLTSIEECSPLMKSDDALLLLAGPSQDKLNLLIRAAGGNGIAAQTGDFYGVVKGY